MALYGKTMAQKRRFSYIFFVVFWCLMETSYCVVLLVTPHFASERWCFSDSFPWPGWSKTAAGAEFVSSEFKGPMPPSMPPHPPRNSRPFFEGLTTNPVPKNQAGKKGPYFGRGGGAIQGAQAPVNSPDGIFQVSSYRSCFKDHLQMWQIGWCIRPGLNIL